ncbi:MAG: DUF3299 domain-containing protein [Gammaproteobacteria bacterium]|nr:DUF3299 domain-containing protein [Gammaproteobacteria bacterium]
MRRIRPLTILALLASLVIAGAAGAATGKPRELRWDDLVPAAGTPLPAPVKPIVSNKGPKGQATGNGTPFSHMYPYNPVMALNGQYVKLPGYVVPLESDEGGLLSEFLLVPYYGACIHVPPPPSNQIVYVKLKKPWRLESMQDPVWVTGTLATQLWTNDAADADYVLTADGVEKFVVN